MVPVAAIVYFLLGVTSLILLNRSKNRMWMDRLAGYMLSWALIFFGLRYAAVSVRDTSWWENMGITSQFDIFQYLFFSFSIAAFAIAAIFPFIYPYPVFQKSSTIKLVAPTTFLVSLAIIISMMLTEYKYVGFWQILLAPSFIILIPIYFRFLSEEMLEGDDTARRMSLAAGTMLIAFFGQQMTWWLAQLLSISC